MRFLRDDKGKAPIPPREQRVPERGPVTGDRCTQHLRFRTALTLPLARSSEPSPTRQVLVARISWPACVEPRRSGCTGDTGQRDPETPSSAVASAKARGGEGVPTHEVGVGQSLQPLPSTSAAGRRDLKTASGPKSTKGAEPFRVHLSVHLSGLSEASRGLPERVCSRRPLWPRRPLGRAWAISPAPRTRSQAQGQSPCYLHGRITIRC